MLRGTAGGIELVMPAERFDAAWGEIERRFAERPEFYRGASATVALEGAPTPEQFALLAAGVARFGVELRGCYGDASVGELAGRLGLAYLGVPPRPTVASFERKRAAREVALTERARSLDADFAGARADIAKRRARGEPSVPRPNFAAPEAAPSAAAPATGAESASAMPSTLYHRGTLRGGQTLQQLGHVVVVGDVNPGAELIATGDIVVFGSLRGTAHAGAQGDASARVLALDLAPTQLRIAAFIAADDGKRRPAGPEVAYVEGERIAIAPHGAAGSVR